MNHTHDVVLVGSGPGGSATAHYLAKAGLDVLLLDKSDFPRDKTCGDGLTPRALAVLAEIGVLGELLRSGCRVSGLEIVAPNRRTITAPIPPRDGVPGYALVVPRRVLDDALRQQAIASGATFLGDVHVTEVEPGQEGRIVKGTQNGQAVSFAGRMVVIATGASTKLLFKMGVLKERPATMVAARSYFEGVRELEGRLQLRFDGVPLPGYGWIFPLSETSANVGAGYFAKHRTERRTLASPRAAFDAFTGTPAMRQLLGPAHRVGRVNGYPLRVDFATAPTFTERTLLVGEAAGLVNPLSGEGVDYALESGRIAAERIIDMFTADDFSERQLLIYDQLLRQRFQALFLFCNRMRDLALNRPALNWLIGVASRRDDLKLGLIDIVLGGKPVSGKVSLRRLLKVVLGKRRLPTAKP